MTLADILHIQINEEGRNIAHEHHHIFLLGLLILKESVEQGIFLLMCNINILSLIQLVGLFYLVYNFKLNLGYYMLSIGFTYSRARINFVIMSSMLYSNFFVLFIFIFKLYLILYLKNDKIINLN